MNIDPSIERLEAILGSTATEARTKGPKSHDHVLLTVRAMITGTPLHALLDSGATRLFIYETPQIHPPRDFIGAYSSLEMANGEKTVSMGLAPDLLVRIDKVQF